MKTNRVKSISFHLLAILLMCTTIHAKAQTKTQPVYVLVHGAWHGGWCWDKVKENLRTEGDLVYTPTLSGMAEDKNHLDTTINLNTHIIDIVNLIVQQDLHHVILVGHSYGGAVIAGVADRIPERLEKLVYLDALLVENGQSALSVNPKGRQDTFTKAASDFDHSLSLPAPSSAWFGVTDTVTIKATNALLTNHPFRTFTQPLTLKHPYGNHLPLVYIACVNPKLAGLEKFAANAKKSRGWKYYELQTGHDAMITMPDELSRLLSSLK